MCLPVLYSSPPEVKLVPFLREARPLHTWGWLRVLGKDGGRLTKDHRIRGLRRTTVYVGDITLAKQSFDHHLEKARSER